MRSLVLLLFFVSIFSFGFSSKKPAPVVVATPPAKDLKAEVLQIVANGKCNSYYWKNRGNPPAGYLKGMSLLFAKNYCLLKKGAAAQVEMSKALGGSDRDALAHYGLKAGSNQENLVTLFTLATGLGMRESSGKYCCGRDTSATNTRNDTAEAGTFQTSWNARLTTTKELFKAYSADESKCLLEVFKEGVKDSYCKANAGNFGSGDGEAYQKLTKRCPAFHAEFTLVAMRSLRKHWGPLNRKEAEFRPECKENFLAIEKLLQSDERLCEQL